MGTSEKEIVKENWDLVTKVTVSTVGRYRFPRHLWADIESAAALALWKAAKNWNGSGNIRPYLVQQMSWDVLDAVRILSGREGSAKAERRLNTLSFDRLEGAAGETTTMYDFVGEEHDPSDFLIADATLQEILAACPNDRHREAVLRTLLGQTMYEIAQHLDVHESRISQMMSKVKHNFRGKPNNRGIMNAPDLLT